MKEVHIELQLAQVWLFAAPAGEGPCESCTPDPGAATERYLQALRAADTNDWGPLITIWRERFEQAGEM